MTQNTRPVVFETALNAVCVTSNTSVSTDVVNKTRGVLLNGTGKVKVVPVVVGMPHVCILLFVSFTTTGFLNVLFPVPEIVDNPCV